MATKKSQTVITLGRTTVDLHIPKNGSAPMLFLEALSNVPEPPTISCEYNEECFIISISGINYQAKVWAAYIKTYIDANL